MGCRCPKAAGVELSKGQKSQTSALREFDNYFIIKAAKWGNYPLVRAFTDLGVELDNQNWEKKRALTYVIDDAQYDLALDMIKAGAECGYKPDANQNLAIYARRSQLPEDEQTREDYLNLMEHLEKYCTE